jgi:hypothetical protein
MHACTPACMPAIFDSPGDAHWEYCSHDHWSKHVNYRYGYRYGYRYRYMYGDGYR